jgi:hypothetical protein
MDALTSGDKNTGIGYNALTALTSGSWNTAVGYEAGKAMTTGADNTAFGLSAGAAITTGTRNIAIGGVALDNADAENDNLAIGYAALGGAINGGEKNVAIGNYSLDALTSGDNNTGVGYGALTSNTTGSQNSAYGQESLYTNTTGTGNTASGYYSLYYNTDGNYNTASGYTSLRSNTTGRDNTTAGYGSLRSNTVGSYNTAIGAEALYDANRTADANAYNTALGYKAGNTGTNDITTGDKNVLLGASTAASQATATNQVVIGYGATGHGDNIAVIGNGSATAIHPHDNNEVDLGSSSYNFKDLYLSGDATIGGAMTYREKITIISSAANTDLSSDTDGGKIFMNANLDDHTILLPQATSSNVGLTYKILIGYTAADFKVGFANGGSTEFRGQVTLMSDVNESSSSIADLAVDSQNFKVFDVNPDDSEKGGGIGSVYELTYITSNLVFISGTAVVSSSAANGTPAVFSSTGI